jgi:ribokinase
MPKTILVAGSLHYDVVVTAERLPALDETLPGVAVRYVAGGKGRNQAVASARNGSATFMAGRIGDDAPGAMLKDDLAGQGVDIGLLQTGAGEASGMSVAITTPAGDYGAVIVSGANLAFAPDQVTLPADTGFVVLQNEITEAANIAMARKAKAAGALVVLNAAPARPADEEFLALVDILVVNRGEAEKMSGVAVANADDAVKAASILSASVPKVVVTLGGEGAVHMRAGGRAERQPAFRASVVSAHGAGDFFIGALVSQLAAGSEFEAAIHYAQAGASIFVSTEVDKRDSIRPVHIRARLGED